VGPSARAAFRWELLSLRIAVDPFALLSTPAAITAGVSR